MRRTDAHRRVAATLDDVLARSGRLDSRPVLRVVRFGGPESYRRRDGGCWIDIPLRYARERSDAALLATVAHEVAHIEYGDLDPPRIEVRPLLLLAALVVLGAVLGGLWGHRLESSGAATGALVFIVLMLGRRTLRNDAAGRSLPREELRADLRAAQLVGRDAVLEMLSLRREPGWFVRSVNRLAPTHPPGELRRSAVSAYDVLADPGVVAAQHL